MPLLPHTSLKFKKNEIETLEFIQTRGFFYSDFYDLASAIDITYNKYRGVIGPNFDFEFVSDFDIEIEGTLHRIVIHAAVTGDYIFSSYSLGICKKDSTIDLIRRFHFDYDHKIIRKKQKAFISHLQYGGKSRNGFNGTKYSTLEIEHSLSVPRLNFPPINLALLLDIVFCEFSNDKTIKIVENPDWRCLVLKNEIFVLKQYYNSISSHIDSIRHNANTLVRDICYT